MKRRLEEKDKDWVIVEDYWIEKDYVRLYREWLIFQIEPDLDRAMVRESILKHLYDAECEIYHGGDDRPVYMTYNPFFTPVRELTDKLYAFPGFKYAKLTDIDNVSIDIRFKSVDNIRLTKCDRVAERFGKITRFVSISMDFYNQCKGDNITLYKATRLHYIWQAAVRCTSTKKVF